MKRLLSTLAMLAIALSASAQDPFTKFKIKVDTGIITKTAVSSVTRAVIGGLYKDLADSVAGRTDTTTKIATQYYVGSHQDGNNYLGTPSFNTTTKVLTMPRTGLSSVTVNIPYPDTAVTSGIHPAAWTKLWPFTLDYTYLSTTVADTMHIFPASGGRVGGAVYAEIVADGSHTPVFDTAFTVTSGAWDNTAGQVNRVIGFKGANGYTLDISQGKIIALPDVTPPTVVSATATTANNIHMVFSEAVTGTTAGYSFSNGSPITITSRSGSGTSSWDFTTSTTMGSSDVITRSYNSGTGNSVDGSSNALATFTSQSVSNSISSPATAISFTQSGVTQSPTGIWSFSASVYNPIYYASGGATTLVGAGRVYVDITSNLSLLGLSYSNSLGGSYTNSDAGIIIIGGDVYVTDGGAGATGPNTVPVGTNYVGLSVTSGGSFKVETSPDAVTWTQLGSTLSHTVTGGSTLYILGTGNGTNHLDNPKKQ